MDCTAGHLATVLLRIKALSGEVIESRFEGFQSFVTQAAIDPTTQQRITYVFVLHANPVCRPNCVWWKVAMHTNIAEGSKSCFGATFINRHSTIIHFESRAVITRPFCCRLRYFCCFRYFHCVLDLFRCLLGICNVL